MDEIKHNLPKELDFKHEAANAERCRINLASSKSRVGPRWEGEGLRVGTAGWEWSGKGGISCFRDDVLERQ